MQLDPLLRCEICSHHLDMEKLLLLVDRGVMEERMKSGGVMFMPEGDSSDELLNQFHLECFLAILDQTNWADDGDEEVCVICRFPLKRWAFRMRIAEIDSMCNVIFQESDHNSALLCPECVISVLDNDDSPEMPSQETRRSYRPSGRRRIYEVL